MYSLARWELCWPRTQKGAPHTAPWPLLPRLLIECVVLWEGFHLGRSGIVGCRFAWPACVTCTACAHGGAVWGWRAPEARGPVQAMLLCHHSLWLWEALHSILSDERFWLQERLWWGARPPAPALPPAHFLTWADECHCGPEPLCLPQGLCASPDPSAAEICGVWDAPACACLGELWWAGVGLGQPRRGPRRGVRTPSE